MKLVIFTRMKKFCLLLLTASLFSVTIFAHDKMHVTETPALDAVGPVITYTALGQSSCTTTRTFTATITDVDGVNINPGTKPRVYYQRVGDANTWIGNTSATGGWKYVEASNAGSPFSFTIDYSLLAGGVVSGQTIQYFVIAQDLNAVPNVGLGSATTFNTAPSSVALTAANFPAGGAINIYNIINALPVLMQIGAAGDFSTLTGAGGLFNAINNVGLAGNTTVEIADALVTENNAFPLYQIQNTGCNAGTATLLIKPAAGVSPTITGSRPNDPLIRILSSNVTIDGSNNGTTSRDMTLTNTNTTGPTVILFGSLASIPISNSVLKNTICVNQAQFTGCVVVSDGSVGGSPGYFNNITIQNNSIQKSGIGILCAANIVAGNGSVLISGNDLNSTSTSALSQLGIYTEGVDGATITNNNIGNFESSIASPRYGIWLNLFTRNSTVSNNIISNIAYTGSSTPSTYGIFLSNGNAASNNLISGNTISNISSGATASVYGIGFSSVASGGITIEKNKISNIKNTNASGYGAYGIGLSSTNTAADITVANNFIFDVAGRGSATTPNVRNGYGIYMSSGGGYKIYYNSVNMNTNQLNAFGTSAALMINGVTTSTSIDLRNNILANTQTSGVPMATRYSIYCANPNTIFSNIDHNQYYVAGTNLGFLGSACTSVAQIATQFGGNTNSISILPPFVSSTDLHIQPVICYMDNRGTPISIATDIDGNTRDAETPDVGADEFNVTYSNTLAGAAGFAVCDNRIVSSTGTTYVNTSCNKIAYILPALGTPVTGKINVCVTRDATQQTFNGEPYVQRHYDIEPATNAANATATVTLYFTDQEFIDYNTNNGAWPKLPTSLTGGNADVNRANVRITQFHGAASMLPSTPGNYPGGWVLIDPVDNDVFWNGTYWEVTIPVNGFSGFYLHTTLYETPLPVVINYFTGRRQGGSHLLNWKVTCSSTPRVTMILERSADSRNFSPINNITADAVRCNQPFDYTDADPVKGMNYYRLKMIDADGKISYSSMVALLNAVKGFDIISIAPNPVVNGNFKLNVASAQSGKMELSIFDMQGRLVKQQNISLIAGFNSLPIKVDHLSAGSYTIRANTMNEQIKIARFVKQ
ncbi:MAG: T9SS type A sorting domain-containing protein [Ferruginibacter sp.]|nr:T9SS type A sorting domain-containing protein [Ferruginibacter sp.]